jgi:Tfp pilus assembly PilM family ATPase
MENHTGIAFTSDAITLSNFQVSEGTRILSNLDKINYPFQYEENIFFLDENIVRLANLLLNKFDSLNLQPSVVSFSIESNLSLVKRVEIPNGLDEKEEARHIEWDLANSFISSIENYVYLKTNNFFDRSTHKEVVVIALRKDIIDFFKKFVDFAKIKLNNLSTNNLATELCYQNHSDNKKEDISLLFRLNDDRLESMCVLDQKLFSSEYEKIKPSSSRSKEEVMLEKITNYIKKMESYFGQMPDSKNNIEGIHLFGYDMRESFVSLLSKNISTKIEVLNPLDNLTLAENLKINELSEYEKSGFVESIGITLDSE